MVADGVFVEEELGNRFVLSLPDAPWADALRDLAKAICERDVRLAGEMKLAKAAMTTGMYRQNIKKHLEKHEASRE